jgi:hypothetical protein
VRQFLPWISSIRSLILRKDCSSSLFRSASEISITRPLRESFAFSISDYKSEFYVGKDRNLLSPTERLTKVFPTFLTSNIEGALMSYQSDETSEVDFVLQLDKRKPLREKGSTTFFFTPFLPFDRRLFCKLKVRIVLDTGAKNENHTFPTAILEELQNSARLCLLREWLETLICQL